MPYPCLAVTGKVAAGAGAVADEVRQKAANDMAELKQALE